MAGRGDECTVGVQESGSVCAGGGPGSYRCALWRTLSAHLMSPKRVLGREGSFQATGSHHVAGCGCDRLAVAIRRQWVAGGEGTSRVHLAAETRGVVGMRGPVSDEIDRASGSRDLCPGSGRVVGELKSIRN